MSRAIESLRAPILRFLLPALTGLALAGWSLAGWLDGGPERHLVEAGKRLDRGDHAGMGPWMALPEATAATRDRALLLRARSALDRGRPSEAVGPLDWINPDGPSAIDAAFWKGRTLFAAGQAMRAVGWFRIVLERRPEHIEALRWLAAAGYESGDRRTAQKSLETVTRLRPDDSRAWRTLAVLYKEDAEPERARVAYEATLDLDPAQPQVRLEAAEVFADLGQPVESARQLELIRGMVPEAARLDLVARTLYDRGDSPGLRSLLHRAVAEHPDHPGLLARMAQVKQFDGEPAEALIWLDRAIAADPFGAPAIYQRAFVLKRMGREAESIQDLARAEALKADLAEMSRLDGEASGRPADAEIRCRVARLCRRLGKFDLALSWYRAAIACDPGNAEARAELDKPVGGRAQDGGPD